MHVLFVPAWYPTPDNMIRGSFFREQAHALKAAGAKVGVIHAALRPLRQPLAAMLHPPPAVTDDAGILTLHRSLFNFTPRMAATNLLRLKPVVAGLFDAYVAANGVPDILHVHSAFPIAAGVQEIQRRHQISYVLSEHSSAYARRIAQPAEIAATQALAQSAAAAFAVSRYQARVLEAELATPPHRWQVIPNSVQEDFLSHPISTSQSNTFRVLHVSSLDANKNASLLIEAFAVAFANAPEVRLILIGTGPERARLEALTERLKIAAQVEFRGQQSREAVRATMAEVDCFALASRTETFGVVLIEALAMGLPLVSTKCGGPEDIVTPENGFLVENETGAMAAALRAARENRAHFGREDLRRQCRTRFAADQLARRWLNIYENVLGGEGLS